MSNSQKKDTKQHAPDDFEQQPTVTTFIDKLPVAPYLALVGLPRSGKSTALAILRLLCRRGLLTADISSAAFYRACDGLTPTLLIDETSTAGDTRTLFHLLRTGTTRDAIAFRKAESYKTFGAKIISWIQLPNDSALNSRCVIVTLQESRRHDLQKPTDPEIAKAADELQKQLLRCRFERYSTVSFSKIPACDQLYSRARDLYEALALPVAEDSEMCGWLASVLQNLQASYREPLSPSESAVLQTLFEAIHMVERKGTVLVRDLTNQVNCAIQSSGARFRVSAREVGAVLTTLGLTARKRTNRGWLVWLDESERKHIHDLVAAYGIDSISKRNLPVMGLYVSHCELCQYQIATELDLTGKGRPFDKKHENRAIVPTQ